MDRSDCQIVHVRGHCTGMLQHPSSRAGHTCPCCCTLQVHSVVPFSSLHARCRTTSGVLAARHTRNCQHGMRCLLRLCDCRQQMEVGCVCPAAHHRRGLYMLVNALHLADGCHHARCAYCPKPFVAHSHCVICNKVPRVLDLHMNAGSACCRTERPVVAPLSSLCS